MNEGGVASKLRKDSRAGCLTLERCRASKGREALTQVSLDALGLILVAVSVSKSTTEVRGFKEWNVK